MFDNIKKCLDDFEVMWRKNEESDLSGEDLSKLLYFEMHLAEELMKNKYCYSERLAKIILANKC